MRFWPSFLSSLPSISITTKSPLWNILYVCCLCGINLTARHHCCSYRSILREGSEGCVEMADMKRAVACYWCNKEPSLPLSLFASLLFLGCYIDFFFVLCYFDDSFHASDQPANLCSFYHNCASVFQCDLYVIHLPKPQHWMCSESVVAGLKQTSWSNQCSPWAACCVCTVIHSPLQSLSSQVVRLLVQSQSVVPEPPSRPLGLHRRADVLPSINVLCQSDLSTLQIPTMIMRWNCSVCKLFNPF